MLFPQHHESTRTQRKREAGSGIRPAGKLQLSQCPLSRIAGTNQKVCVHCAGQQFSAEMAAGKCDINDSSDLTGEEICSFLCLSVSQLWQEISEENRQVQDIMMTLENFQLDTTPSKPANLDDCEIRPVHVEPRYGKLTFLVSLV